MAVCGTSVLLVTHASPPFSEPPTRLHSRCVFSPGKCSEIAECILGLTSEQAALHDAAVLDEAVRMSERNVTGGTLPFP